VAASSINYDNATSGLASTNIQDAADELATRHGAGTVVTVGTNGTYATFALALAGAEVAAAGAANVVLCYCAGYHSEGGAISLPDYVILAGTSPEQVVLGGTLTFDSVANKGGVYGIGLTDASITNLLANVLVGCDRVIEGAIEFGFDGGPGAPAATTVYRDLLWPCYIVSSVINVSPSGSMTVDVWHHDDARPTVANTITTAAAGFINTSAERTEDLTLSGVATRSLGVGQIAGNLISAATCTIGVLQLKVRRWAVS
jgi:hypothetical protein